MKNNRRKNRVVKSLLMFVLLSTTGLALASCGKKLEKNIAFYNMTPFAIEQITLATESTRLDDKKKKVVLDYGEDVIEGEGTREIIFNIPEKDVDESWFLHIQGGDGSNSFGTEEEIGTIFMDNIIDVEISFDEVEQKFIYTVGYE